MFCVPLSYETKPTSLLLVEIKGTEGRDLTIPCHAPSYLNKPSLNWSFSNSEDPSHILTYNSRSGDSTSSSYWDNHVELDGFRVPFGDGSLRLMDPKHSEHTGSYTCVFSIPYTTHTERTEVTIKNPAGEATNAVIDQRGMCADCVSLSILSDILSVALQAASPLVLTEDVNHLKTPN